MKSLFPQFYPARYKLDIVKSTWNLPEKLDSFGFQKIPQYYIYAVLWWSAQLELYDVILILSVCEEEPLSYLFCLFLVQG